MNKPLIYKYREKTKEMVEIGVLTEDNKVILNSPHLLEDKDISLYDTEFYIKKIQDEVSTYQCIFPSNKKELGEITTNAEGQYYSLGYMKDGVLVFYDQFIL